MNFNVAVYNSSLTFGEFEVLGFLYNNNTAVSSTKTMYSTVFSILNYTLYSLYYLALLHTMNSAAGQNLLAICNTLTVDAFQ